MQRSVTINQLIQINRWRRRRDSLFLKAAPLLFLIITTFLFLDFYSVLVGSTRDQLIYLIVHDT